LEGKKKKSPKNLIKIEWQRNQLLNRNILEERREFGPITNGNLERLGEEDLMGKSWLYVRRE